MSLSESVKTTATSCSLGPMVTVCACEKASLQAKPTERLPAGCREETFNTHFHRNTSMRKLLGVFPFLALSRCAMLSLSLASLEGLVSQLFSSSAEAQIALHAHHDDLIEKKATGGSPETATPAKHC